MSFLCYLLWCMHACSPIYKYLVTFTDHFGRRNLLIFSMTCLLSYLEHVDVTNDVFVIRHGDAIVFLIIIYHDIINGDACKCRQYTTIVTCWVTKFIVKPLLAQFLWVPYSVFVDELSIISVSDIRVIRGHYNMQRTLLILGKVCIIIIIVLAK